MERTIPLTQQKYDELTTKLKYYETVKRTEISYAIKAAKEFGDLSENAEYSAAKDAQEKLEIEIANLSDILVKAYPIDSSLLNNKTVQVGNFVTVYDTEFEEELKYRVVSSIEASSGENKISDQSPIGKALIGRAKGDIVVSKTPAGEIKLKILDISK